jgi:hypothetical protein
MGGDFVETGEMVICGGDDVLKELNDAFGDPTSAKYQYAQSNNTFGAIQNVAGNYKALIDAYTKAGVPVSARWGAYLRLLGTVGTQGPQNIYDIAQTRDNGLSQGVGMSTVVHVPKNGGHVHAVHGRKGGSPSSIDSPCPLPPAKP